MSIAQEHVYLKTLPNEYVSRYSLLFKISDRGKELSLYPGEIDHYSLNLLLNPQSFKKY